MNTEKGSALLIVLLLAFILAIMGTALFSGATRSFTASQAENTQLVDNALIESAANDAYSRLHLTDTVTNRFIHDQLAAGKVGCSYIYNYSFTPPTADYTLWEPAAGQSACAYTYKDKQPQGKFVTVTITQSIPSGRPTPADWQFKIHVSEPKVGA